MSSYEEIKKSVFQAAESNFSELKALNDDLADHPEISGQEFESSAKIVELLRRHGFTVEYPFAGLPTAFKAVSGSKKHGRKVAILTEYDALPEVGHACGHCVSGSISVLAGIAMMEAQDALDVDVDVIGTPVEETDGAKCTMVKQGVFDGYDMAMMIHLDDKNILAPKLLALDSYLYSFKGKAAHASAAPWDGVNALNAAQLMVHAVDMLRQHVTPDVRMHSVYRDGGAAPNIVPETASVEYYVRAEERGYLNDLVRKVDDCARGAAIATQTTYEKAPTAEAYDNLKNNATGLAVLAEVYEELDLPTENTETTFGSSDVGNVSFVCPTFQPTLAIAKPGTPIHTREFADAVKTDLAHDMILKGAEVICLQIIRIFSDPQLLEGLKKDFER